MKKNSFETISIRFIVLPIVFYFFSFYSKGQVFSEVNFAKADSVAKRFSDKKIYNLDKLVDSLTSNFEDEVIIYRSFFKWVTNNIDYGGSAVYNKRNILRNQKAKCEGYAKLLIEMCSIVGIEAKYYSGVAKNGTSVRYYKKHKPKHGWLCVKLNGTWYFSEPTWAASFYVLKNNKPFFIKKENHETYFICNPELFIYDHFPLNPKDQLLDKNISIFKFNKYPKLGDKAKFYHEFFYKIPKGIQRGRRIKIYLNKKIEDLHLSPYKYNSLSKKHFNFYPVKVKKISNGNYKYVFKNKYRGRGTNFSLYAGEDEIFEFTKGL